MINYINRKRHYNFITIFREWCCSYIIFRKRWIRKSIKKSFFILPFYRLDIFIIKICCVKYFFIIVVLFFADSIGIFSIAWGYLIGTIIQFTYLYYKTNHISKISYKKLQLSELTSFFSLSFLLIIFIESIGQIYSLADRFLYYRVDSGGIAALNYAFIIF